MTSKQGKLSESGYNPQAAGTFWSRRLRSTNPLAAVLTYNAHPALNRAYDRWERESLERLLPLSLEKKNALDIGCGIGRLTILLAKLGANVTAVDISNDMLVECCKRARKHGLESRLKLLHGSAHEIASTRYKFDVITCFGLLEHLPVPQRRACLERSFQLLKKRGKMFVTVNNRSNQLLSGRYRLKNQRGDGYFVGLVGLEGLRTVCRKHEMTLTVRAANPFYALVHYLLVPDRKALAFSDREFQKLCRQACSLDLEHPTDGPLADRLASHFIVEISRRP